MGQGQNVLRYLARYVFRVAIANNRIKRIENNSITFLYKNREKKKWNHMTLDAMAFIRRFLQHVLPRGFMKIQYHVRIHYFQIAEHGIGQRLLTDIANQPWQSI